MIQTLRVLVFAFSLFVVCNAGLIQVQNCSDVVNKVTNVEVDVSDCDSGNNCTLYKGTTYYLKTTFTPNEDFPMVRMRTVGVMGILKVPYMTSDVVCPEATTEDGENCDPDVGMLRDKQYTHVKDFPVRRIYPKMNMKARVEYFTASRSSRRSMILCYEIPISIQNNPDDENEIEES